MLPATGHQLQHTAARDKIAVKNKRRQPTKEKVIVDDRFNTVRFMCIYFQLSTLKETDDHDDHRPSITSKQGR
jgi:hypothetical protein